MHCELKTEFGEIRFKINQNKTVDVFVKEAECSDEMNFSMTRDEFIILRGMIEVLSENNY